MFFFFANYKKRLSFCSPEAAVYHLVLKSKGANTIDTNIKLKLFKSIPSN